MIRFAALWPKRSHGSNNEKNVQTINLEKEMEKLMMEYCKGEIK